MQKASDTVSKRKKDIKSRSLKEQQCFVSDFTFTKHCKGYSSYPRLPHLSRPYMLYYFFVTYRFNIISQLY